MKDNKKRVFFVYLLVTVLLSSIFVSSALAAPIKLIPGTVSNTTRALPSMVSNPNSITASSSTALKPIVNETGFITLSLDAKGVNDNAHANIRVDKPSTGATVRSAYLATADVWGLYGGPLANGIVQLNGVPVTWNKQVTAPYGPHNAWADVTSIIKPIADAAPKGIVNIDYTEKTFLDGSTLAVIFDDPAKTVNNSVVLLFGAQNISGDTFNIALADPVNKNDPKLAMDFSLGISFGYQPTNQVSYVTVNGKRLTSSAGGQDDGFSENGGLITVGGIGDSNANPLDPYAGASSIRYDDELYNLLPFVNDGDTKITVDTINPSNDDNIFFAGLSVSSANAIVGEGIILDPVSDKGIIGNDHKVTATLQDDEGNLLVNREVTFNIISGPNKNKTAVATTDSNGKASFTYTSLATGTDTINASFTNSQGKTQFSNQVQMEWAQPPVPSFLSFSYFNMTGNPIPFKGPTDSAVDSSGNLYVTDYYNNRVVEFDVKGQFLYAYGLTGSGEGQFNKPSGIAIDDSDNVYVADTYNNRIVCFKDSNGDGSIDDWQVCSGIQFSMPMGVCVKGNQLYVADTYNNRIAVFDESTGTWVTFGAKGSTEGKFNKPYDLAVDSQGQIWVSDTFNNRVQEFDQNGQYIRKYSENSPYGIAVDSHDNVFVAERQKADIKCVNISKTYGGKGNTAGLFKSPVGVNIDTNGTMWVVDVTSGKIQSATP